MSLVRVEKGVPIPEFYMARYQKLMRGPNCGRKPKYPFKSMEIGDSFALPLRYHNRMTAFRQITSMYGRRYGKKFLVIQDDTHKPRCWRIA